MDPIFNNDPHYWVTGSKYWILLFILRVFQILDNIRKEVIQNLSSFYIILLDSNGLATFQNFLLSHTFSTFRF